MRRARRRSGRRRRRSSCARPTVRWSLAPARAPRWRRRALRSRSAARGRRPCRLADGGADLLARVRELTGLDLGLFRERAPLAATVDGARRRAGARRARRAAATSRWRATDYRGRVERIVEPAGPPVELALLRDSVEHPGEGRPEPAADRRPAAGLPAARARRRRWSSAGRSPGRSAPSCRPRAGSAAATSPIPSRSTATTSSPSSGASSTACRGSSRRKIEEVERKRGELEETIRRVGRRAGHGPRPRRRGGAGRAHRRRRLRGRGAAARCRSTAERSTRAAGSRRRPGAGPRGGARGALRGVGREGRAPRGAGRGPARAVATPPRRGGPRPGAPDARRGGRRPPSTSG